MNVLPGPAGSGDRPAIEGLWSGEAAARSSSFAEDMSIRERGSGAGHRDSEAAPQILRVVIDVIQQCNLRCTYCHPGEVWRPRHLCVDSIAGVLAGAERHGVLEVVLSGGEPTLHPQFAQVLNATAVLDRTAGVLVTNATRVDQAMAERIGGAKLARVCVSLDGIHPAIHATARGDNQARVVGGLRRIREAGARVTVISVVHQGNFRQIGELSDWLLSEGLADQHHLCAPSYSGEAREHYPDLALRWDDFFAVQASVDERHTALADGGLFVTFNSFWPATGKRSPVVDAGRTLTLQQVSEQVKGTLLHVRPDGEVRATATSWGRETVGNAAMGNVTTDDPYDLINKADRWYRDGVLGQLPREVEAQHKFQLGGCDARATDRLIDDNGTQPIELIRLVELRPMTHLSVLDNPLTQRELAIVRAALRRSAPEQFRTALHPSGVGIVYDRFRSHVTLLTSDEWETFTQQPPRPQAPVQ